LRKLIIAVGALAAAAPLAAQPRPDPRDEDSVRALPQREEIKEIGETMARVTDALMDIDIGPIIDAVEGRRHTSRHRETLGDIATRGDPHGRERIRDQVAIATVGVGAAAEQVAVMTPVLRRSLEDAARRMEEAMAQGRRDVERDLERGRSRSRDRDDRRDRRDEDDAR
jgi:hypothetical protein